LKGINLKISINKKYTERARDLLKEKKTSFIHHKNRRRDEIIGSFKKSIPVSVLPQEIRRSVLNIQI